MNQFDDQEQLDREQAVLTLESSDLDDSALAGVFGGFWHDPPPGATMPFEGWNPAPTSTWPRVDGAVDPVPPDCFPTWPR